MSNENGGRWRRGLDRLLRRPSTSPGAARGPGAEPESAPDPPDSGRVQLALTPLSQPVELRETRRGLHVLLHTSGGEGGVVMGEIDGLIPGRVYSFQAYHQGEPLQVEAQVIGPREGYPGELVLRWESVRATTRRHLLWFLRRRLHSSVRIDVSAQVAENAATELCLITGRIKAAEPPASWALGPDRAAEKDAEVQAASDVPAAPAATRPTVPMDGSAPAARAMGPGPGPAPARTPTPPTRRAPTQPGHAQTRTPTPPARRAPTPPRTKAPRATPPPARGDWVEPERAPRGAGSRTRTHSQPGASAQELFYKRVAAAAGEEE